MYVVFKVSPYHKKVIRSNTKKPKYYSYDNARIKDEGARLENLVANSLFKECHFRQDCLGQEYKLYYLAKNGGVEIDFAITLQDSVAKMIEVKSSGNTLSKNFATFKKDLPDAQAVQLVHNLAREKTYPDGSEVRSLGEWLCRW